ncbi:formate/nitrite transporter family protein [Peptoniphilus sp. AGMB00490]|uniref:Formate/nitrite transporter family protein n=1 Tax=Peptoniphilus faecalis TaxID=2731255 RepID=A0A848RIS9_9FIRM|nr:formate/nitrite transporter family protein [Peptoniphilus faecalis]NMW85721.1 formate/nitrite transporter family protein [Peptoniphilus faecalis]
MYKDIITGLINSASNKKNLLEASLFKYIISSMLAGFFIGIGMLIMILSTNVFSPLPIAAVKFINGFFFSLALSFVVFAGGELFTGNVLVTTLGRLNKKIETSTFLKILIFSYIGNLLGSILIAFLFKMTGVSPEYNETLLKLVAGKTNFDFTALLFKGIMCNILVCIAVLICSRKISDSAKLILIFWCILAFVSLGFEHSVANMTCFALAKILNPEFSFALILKNLIPVTIGNIVGGVLVAITYNTIGKDK